MSIIKYLTGICIGTSLGIILTSNIYSKRYDQEIKNNLSQNVVKVTETVRASNDEKKSSFEKNLEDAIIIAYADNIGKHDWKLPIKSSEYLKYKEMTHGVEIKEDFVKFVTFDNENIKERAEALTQYCKTNEEKASVLLDFVHQHVYDKRIEEDRDYVKYPIETIVERCGDCEDLSILGAALIKSIGINVALIHVPPEKGKKEGHMALGIEGKFSGSFYNIGGKKYYYAETTGTEWLSNKAKWTIGQMPARYRKKKIEIYVLK